jgi:VIT1/CCC1 family predicted Fe2+/Mn2+ transporter
MKVRGLSIYLKSDPGHPIHTAVSDIGKGHKSVNEGGNLRASVFGINDGLISNFSLLMGLAGASSGHHTLMLSGIAGLLAGAFSMAAGEYVSVRSQREMYEYQIALESEELEEYPEAEAAELALIYEARGLPKNEAQKIATTIIQNPKQALDTLTREELGLNPEELGSPPQAAFFSFISFAIGSFIPLLPFLINLKFGILFSAILTGTGLFVTGAILSLFTGRNALLNGLRILLIGAAAGALTYLIGYGLGVSLN